MTTSAAVAAAAKKNKTIMTLYICCD